MSKEVAHADTPCPPFYFPRPFQNKMATKRKRKVAFREDVDIDDKKKKQFEDAEEDISTENQRSKYKAEDGCCNYVVFSTVQIDNYSYDILKCYNI